MEYCTEEEPTVQSMDCSESGQEEDDYDKSIAKGGVTTPFPWKLHDMLDAMALEGSHSVVTWQPHGRAFMVHKPKDFVEKIMPKYFNQTKVSDRNRLMLGFGMLVQSCLGFLCNDGHDLILLLSSVCFFPAST